MKNLIVAALVFSAAGGAFAQSTEGSGQTYGFLGVNSPAASQNAAAGKTRAEVAAEMKEAPAVTDSFEGISPPAGTSDKIIRHGKTRAEVVAELKQAEQDGTLDKVDFAGIHSPEYRTEQGKTRAEVAAELKQAKRDGTLQKEE